MIVNITITNNSNILSEVISDIPEDQLNQIGVTVVQLFVDGKLCKSKSECRNAIKQNGIRCQDILIYDVNARITHSNNITYIIQRATQ